MVGLFSFSLGGWEWGGDDFFSLLHLKKKTKADRLLHTAGNQEEVCDWLASSPG